MFQFQGIQRPLLVFMVTLMHMPSSQLKTNLDSPVMRTHRCGNTCAVLFIVAFFVTARRCQIKRLSPQDLLSGSGAAFIKAGSSENDEAVG